jgi:alpha-beta hydrolase superfamily lysophospholipase
MNAIQTPLAIPVDGINLAAALHEPPGAERWPAVVTAHGLRSSMGSDKYVRLAEAFPARGVALCRFDFRGCGESGGALATSTLSDELHDLRAVIARVRRHPRFDGRLALMGSSMGGFLSVHAAAAEGGAVTAVVTWAAPASLEDLTAREEVARDAGFGEPFVAELRAGRMLSAPGGVGRILIIHGAADEVVPVEHAHRLWARCTEPRRLEVMAGADHSVSDPAHRAQAVALTVEWCLTAFGMAA